MFLHSSGYWERIDIEYPSYGANTQSPLFSRYVYQVSFFKLSIHMIVCLLWELATSFIPLRKFLIGSHCMLASVPKGFSEHQRAAEGSFTGCIYSILLTRQWVPLLPIIDTCESKIPTRINNLYFGDNFQIFPNPSKGDFIIQVKSDLHVSEIELFDLQGNKIPITNRKINNTFNVQVLRHRNFGSYILKIITNVKSISREIDIKK